MTTRHLSVFYPDLNNADFNEVLRGLRMAGADVEAKGVVREQRVVGEDLESGHDGYLSGNSLGQTGWHR